MKWIKKGHIFKPSGEFEWSQDYAQVPTPIYFGDYIRIFFTTRPKPLNDAYVSFTSFIDISTHNPQNILYKHNKPILQLGDLGSFDEYGIMPGSIIKINNNYILYYTGWLRELSVPYSTSIGLAISNDNCFSFNKNSNGPLLSKSINDPFLINGPYVIYENNQYHMWYSSCYLWEKNLDRIDPIYKIKHALSSDGLNWVTEKTFCIEEFYPKEAQNAPCVFKHNNLYIMVFCYRKSQNFRNSINGYKLGYAISKDLINWERKQDFELIGEESSWDNEMQAYPRVLKVEDEVLLFYCGNYFGKEGFGYAELDLNSI